MTEEIVHIPPYSWYENFFQERVLAKVATDMGDCTGFCSWLAENDPALAIRIQEAELEMNSLWMSRADRESFKGACKTWYNLLMEAKKGFDAWKGKQQEALLNVGRQEALAIR